MAGSANVRKGKRRLATVEMESNDMRSNGTQVSIFVCIFLCVWMNASCFGQRIAERLAPTPNPPNALIGAWKSTQVHPSLGAPKDYWLMIGKTSSVSTDWQLPLKEGRVRAVSKGVMFAELISWDKNQQLSSLDCQFNPIQVASGRYANIPIEISDKFSHSYLIKYELTKDQKLRLWIHMDALGLKSLLQSGSLKRESPTSIAVKGLQDLTDNGQGTDPLALLFPSTPTFIFNRASAPDEQTKGKGVLNPKPTGAKETNEGE